MENSDGDDDNEVVEITVRVIVITVQLPPVSSIIAIAQLSLMMLILKMSFVAIDCCLSCYYDFVFIASVVYVVIS